MTRNQDGLHLKRTVRQTARGAEQTHVWARTDDRGSRSRQRGMRSGLDQQATLAEGGGSFSNTPPAGGSAGYANSGPSPAARNMFGSAADDLASRPTPSVSFGAQKWSVSGKPASAKRAMTALDDFRHVSTPFAADSLGRVFAGVR